MNRKCAERLSALNRALKSSAMSSRSQTSNAVLLVRPRSFGFHAEAAASNAFAQAPADAGVQSLALEEFEGLCRRLSQARVNVLVLDDAAGPAKPDAIFPNNWVTFHSDGTIVLYPMATAARRLERNLDGMTALLKASGFDVRRVVDLSAHEAEHWRKKVEVLEEMKPQFEREGNLKLYNYRYSEAARYANWDLARRSRYLYHITLSE